MTNNSDIKKRNMLGILNALRRFGPVSKPDIAAMTGLTQVTVQNLINELLAGGIAVECGAAQSTGGRPAALYKLSGDIGFAIGIRLLRDRIVASAHGLELDMQYENAVTISLANVEDCVNAILDEIQTILSAVQGPCLGIGVTIPGRVDNKGVVLHIPGAPAWNGYPMKKAVEAITDAPVTVENDNNSFVVSARWTRFLPEKADAVFLQCTEGVGVGISIKGELFYGSNYHACEIGHTVLDPDGPICSCGKKGCVEAYTCDRVILDGALRQWGTGRMTAREIAEATKTRQDSEMLALFSRTACYIAITIANLVHLFDSSCVILQSNWLDLFPDLFSDLKEYVYARCDWKTYGSLEIVLYPKEYQSVNAAACVALDRLFRRPEENGLLNMARL